jgi:hypothetical protein
VARPEHDAGVFEKALARLVSAVIKPDDSFDGECTTEVVLATLTQHDRTVLTNIASRIAAIERADGAARAEAALADIVALLSDGRAAA